MNEKTSDTSFFNSVVPIVRKAAAAAFLKERFLPFYTLILKKVMDGGAAGIFSAAP